MIQLPTEILYRIMMFCDAMALFKIGQLSKYFKSIATCNLERIALKIDPIFDLNFKDLVKHDFMYQHMENKCGICYSKGCPIFKIPIWKINSCPCILRLNVI